MKKAVIFLLMVITFYFLNGCSSLPKENLNQGILVILGENNHPDSFVKYRLYYTDEKFITYYPKNGITVFKGLDPGKYHVPYIKSYYKESNTFSRQFDAGLIFTIEAGEISILNVKIVIDKKQKSGELYQTIDRKSVV